MKAFLRMQRSSILTVLLVLALLGQLGQSRRVRLRTGTIDVGRTAQRATVASAGGDNNGGANVSSISKAEALAYRSRAAWGQTPSLRLYLVSYGTDDIAAAQQQAGSKVRAALLSLDASILSYIPENTFLVAARPKDLERAINMTGATAVEYGPEHCIAPEWAPLLQAAASSGSSSSSFNSISSISNSDTSSGLTTPPSTQQRRRRQRRQLQSVQDPLRHLSAEAVRNYNGLDDVSSGSHGSNGDSSSRTSEAVHRDSTADGVIPGRVVDSSGEGSRSSSAVETLYNVQGTADEGGADAVSAAVVASRAALLAQMRTFNPEAVFGGRKHEQRRRRRLAKVTSSSAAAASSRAAAALPPLYELSVQMLPGLPAAALAAAEADWPAALASATAAAAAAQNTTSGNVSSDGSSSISSGACLPLVVAVRGLDGKIIAGSSGGGGPWLQVFMCEKDLAGGVQWLAAQPVVRWVAPRPRMSRRNARASILMQTGSLTLAQYNEPIGSRLSGADPSRRPYWAAGVDGSGEVVGLGDSGIDLDSCYFADGVWLANATAGGTSGGYKSLLSGYPQRMVLPGHRKLAQYWLAPGSDFGDNPLEAGGHGSHTSATVAGSILADDSCPAGPFLEDSGSGAAPRARVSMVDMCGRGDDGVFHVPMSLELNYLPIHTSAGAAITSDSWGSVYNVYDVDAQAFDTFLWRNPDVISFVAAGNNGTDALTPGGSIGSPATAKSVVAVGASVRMPVEARMGYRALLVRGWRSGGSGREEAWRVAVYPRENLYLPTLSYVLTTGLEVPLVAASPLTACSPLTNTAASLQGAIVLVMAGGNCLPYQKVQAVLAAAGGKGGTTVKAVVLVNNVPLMPDNGPDITVPGTATAAAYIPVSYISQGLGAWFLGNISSGLISLTLTATVLPVGVDSVPSFSSYGPMADGRIKPDLVAPGAAITSAGAKGGVTGGLCSSLQANMSGTSMATPQAAGHTALLRHYLRAGFYPTGSPNDTASAPFVPSGPLMKALLIAGAKALTGGLGFALGQTLGPPPDGFQGWGRLNLAGSLPLKGVTDPRVALQLADRGQFTSSGQEVVLRGLVAAGTGPVTVVLSWYDYPADLNSDTQLVNNLDLTVEVGSATASAAATVVLGNNAEDAASQVADRVNTVERVLLSSPPAGAPLTIRVKATNLPSVLMSGYDAAMPQRFSVAVIGHINGTLVSELNPAYVRQQQQPLQQSQQAKPPPQASSSPPPSPRPFPSPSSPPPPPPPKSSPPPRPPPPSPPPPPRLSSPPPSPPPPFPPPPPPPSPSPNPPSPSPKPPSPPPKPPSPAPKPPSPSPKPPSPSPKPPSPPPPPPPPPPSPLPPPPPPPPPPSPPPPSPTPPPPRTPPPSPPPPPSSSALRQPPPFPRPAPRPRPTPPTSSTPLTASSTPTTKKASAQRVQL